MTSAPALSLGASSDRTPLPGVIRKLGIFEQDEYCEHLLRLGPADRRLRFCGTTNEAAIHRYCEKRRLLDSLVLGYFSDGVLRGAAELAFDQGKNWRPTCEAALSVEGPFQNLGIGTELFRRLVSAASNRWSELIRMLWLEDNVKMEAIAAKFGPVLSVGLGQVECEIRPPWPSIFTYLEEPPTGYGPTLGSALRWTN